MNRHRAVALRLAGLAPADRRWLLERIPAGDRPGILGELPAAQRLSAADPDQCSRWLRQLAEDGRTQNAEVPQECLDTIDCAPGDAVARVIGTLPRVLQAEIVRQRPWRWKLGFIEHLSERDRQDLARFAAAPGLKPALRQALLAHVADALRSARPELRPFETWLQDAAAVPAGA